MFLKTVLSLLFCVCIVTPGVFSLLMTQPEQIHISYGSVPTEMMVTWVTFDPTNTSTVEYGPTKLSMQKTGNATKFVDGGIHSRVLYIHRVLLTNLIPGAQYVYHCGSNDGWSSIYWFTAMKSGYDWSPKFAVYGDLGNVNGQSIPRLQEEVQKGTYDAVLHVGDFAYDMDTDDAKVGDEFMRQIETVAAYVPYMTCVGNHESAYNFSNYANRFSMLNKDGVMNNHFYSFNIGPAHIIAFSTEFYFFYEYGWTQIVRQYQWLENDLKEANLPQNRAQRPWIITMGHRPMYCSTDDGDDCTHKESIIRKGIPILKAFGLEDLFYKYGVDLELWAHEHVYERLWPVYDRKVYNGSYDFPYTNPKAPVHIITGSAGCQEKHDPFVQNPAEWSALRNADYGYTRMAILNKTHIYLEQVSDDKGGAVIDKMMLVKDKHGPEAWLLKTDTHRIKCSLSLELPYIRILMTMTAAVINSCFKRMLQRTVSVGSFLFRKHLLVTNATFSMAMGVAGDLVQQHYEILTDQEDKWSRIRTFHMAAAGLSTGVLSHYWYILIDIFIPGSSFKCVIKKVLYDQIFFSPVNLTVYFGTVAILEGSLKHLKEELVEKGVKIYTAEWLIWPPAQFFNFYVLPLRYRVFFDNFISFGFDIYSPYVKYKCKLKSETQEINNNN